MTEKNKRDNFRAVLARTQGLKLKKMKMKIKLAAVLVLIFACVNMTAAARNDKNEDFSTRSGKELVASKNILIIDLLENELRVTEIFHLLNSNEHAVDLKEAPLFKRLPAAAFNIRYLGHNKTATPEISSGKLVFAHKVPPGEQRLFFSYNLPLNSASVALNHFFPLDTKEFEVITPEKTLELSIETDSAAQHPVINRKKTFDKYTYDSKVIVFSVSPKRARLEIKNVPISQNKLFYPAAAGCALMFLSLFWYLKRKD